MQLEREGTPELVDEQAVADGQTAEMRRLLRAPRYFDEDFEAVRFSRPDSSSRAPACSAEVAGVIRERIVSRSTHSQCVLCVPQKSSVSLSHSHVVPLSPRSPAGGIAVLPLRGVGPPGKGLYTASSREARQPAPPNPSRLCSVLPQLRTHDVKDTFAFPVRPCAHDHHRPCYLCGEGGHLVRDCPNDLCYNCNKCVAGVVVETLHPEPAR